MTETVLTELIKYLESIKEQIPLSDRQHSYNNALKLAKGKAISLLPKEREQHKTLHLDGKIFNKSDMTFEEYYENNFTQYKPVNNE